MTRTGREESRGRGSARKHDIRSTAMDFSSVPQAAEGSGEDGKAKSVAELIAEAAALDDGFRGEISEATEDGELSEKSYLLTMAQREEVFMKKCVILDKYTEKLRESYSDYRKRLEKLEKDLNECCSEAYSRGHRNGFSKGSLYATDKMTTEVDKAWYANRKYRRLTWLFGVTTVLALFATLWLAV